MTISVSVIITTKNEEERLPACLAALRGFGEVIVVDSMSTDRTAAIATAWGAQVVPFVWDGRYPKKRQWCLDRVPTRYEWVFFVDADEVVTGELAAEIRGCGFDCAGYFVRGRYIWNGRALGHGLKNNKLALIDRRKVAFPVVDDLDLPGMGEMEGHYQPVLKPGFEGERMGQIGAALDHHAAHSEEQWLARHRRYAAWERGMNARRAWPEDPVRWRQGLKTVFRGMPGRPAIAFLHCYVWKGGWKDAAAGLDFARKRAAYYRMIAQGEK